MKAFHKHMLVAAVALGLGASAMAAEATMCDQAEPMMRGQQAGRMDHAKMAERMKERMNQHHAALHDKLKLNAEQEAAWKSFIAGATPPMMGAHMDRTEMMKLSGPERMEKMIGFMKDREARMTVRLVELKKFYAVLTPEQQKVFDAEMMKAHRGGKMARGHRHAPPPASAPAAK